MIQDSLKKRDFSEDALVLARAASIIRKDIFNHEGILLEGCLWSGKELKTLQHQCSVHQPWYKKGHKHYQSFTRFLDATQPLLFGEKGRSRSGKLGWRLKRLQTLLCTYNPGQNYLRIFTPTCTLSNATTLFQQQLICGTKFPSPQVNVVSYKCLRIRVALEHTTTLLPRGGGKGGRRIARMLAKMVWECDIFSTVLSKIVASHPFEPLDSNCENFRKIERLIVLVYDKTSTSLSINQTRRELFCLKNVTMERMPPTQNALLQHTKRAVYQAFI